MFVKSVSRQREIFAGTCRSIFELVCYVYKCGGGGQCVTFVVAAVFVGVCPLWE